MKSLGYLILIFFCINCSKDERAQKIIIEVNLTTNEEFQYDLGNLPVEGSVKITKQAREFTVSKITTDAESGGLIFVFIPKENYSGTETIEITRQEFIGNSQGDNLVTVFDITVE